MAYSKSPTCVSDVTQAQSLAGRTRPAPVRTVLARYARSVPSTMSAAAELASSSAAEIRMLACMPARNDPCAVRSACCSRRYAPTSPTGSAAPATCWPPTRAARYCIPVLRNGRPGSRTRSGTRFLHPAARELLPDWEQKAPGCVAHLRAVAGRDPDAPDLAALVGEPLVKSPDFGRLWARYEVRRVGDGEKVFRHPNVGTLTLAHENLELNHADGQRLIVFMAEPGTTDHDAMLLLDQTSQDAQTPTVPRPAGVPRPTGAPGAPGALP